MLEPVMGFENTRINASLKGCIKCIFFVEIASYCNDVLDRKRLACMKHGPTEVRQCSQCSITDGIMEPACGKGIQFGANTKFSKAVEAS